MTSAREIKTHESTRTGDKTTADLQGTLMTSLSFLQKVKCATLIYDWLRSERCRTMVFSLDSSQKKKYIP